MGVSLQQLSKEDKKRIGSDCGVKIEMVVPGSPAEEAGLLEGWMIISMNGERICKDEDVQKVLSKAKTNDILTLIVITEESEQEVFVELADRSEYDASSYLGEILKGKRKYIGLRLQHMTPQLKDFFGVENGILIVEVEPSSPAAKASLKAGDIILSVDGHLIDRISDVRKLMKRISSGDKMLLVLDRKDDLINREIVVSERNLLSLDDLDVDDWMIVGQEIDFEELKSWIKDLVSDSTKAEIKASIEKLKKEIETLQKNL